MEKQCNKREFALKRAEELKNRIKEYNDVKSTIPRGKVWGGRRRFKAYNRFIYINP